MRNLSSFSFTTTLRASTKEFLFGIREDIKCCRIMEEIITSFRVITEVHLNIIEKEMLLLL